MKDNNFQNRKKAFADLGLFYAALVWGSTFFMVKSALSDIDPVIMVAYRFLIAGLILLLYLLVNKQPIFKDIKKGLILALILWLLYLPQTIGLQYTSASNSGFITGLFVAFVPIFLPFFKKKPNLFEIIATIISLLGLWILTGGLTMINIGDMLTLGAAMTYALHLLFCDKYIKGGVNPVIICAQQFLFIGIFSLITGLLFDLPFTVGSYKTMGIVLFLGLFPTLSAFVIQLFAQKLVSPLRVSLIFAFEPVFAGIFAYTLGGETFMLHSAIGGFCIFIALVISGIPIKNQRLS